MIYNFLGSRSVCILSFSCVIGLLLAAIELLLSAYIVKLLSLIGVFSPDGGLFAELLNITDDPYIVLSGFILVALLRSSLHIAKGYFAVSANELFITRLRFLCISSTLKSTAFRVLSMVTPTVTTSLFVTVVVAVVKQTELLPLKQLLVRL